MALELQPGPMHWLGSHHALRACSLSLWPSRVPLQHSLLAHSGCLQAIRVIQHPTLQRILLLEAFCAVGAVLLLPRGGPLSVQFHFTRLIRSCERRNTTDLGASQRDKEPMNCSTQGGFVRTTLASRLCSL